MFNTFMRSFAKDKKEEMKKYEKIIIQLDAYEKELQGKITTLAGTTATTSYGANQALINSLSTKRKDIGAKQTTLLQKKVKYDDCEKVIEFINNNPAFQTDFFLQLKIKNDEQEIINNKLSLSPRPTTEASNFFYKTKIDMYINKFLLQEIQSISYKTDENYKDKIEEKIQNKIIVFVNNFCQKFTLIKGDDTGYLQSIKNILKIVQKEINDTSKTTAYWKGLSDDYTSPIGTAQTFLKEFYTKEEMKAEIEYIKDDFLLDKKNKIIEIHDLYANQVNLKPNDIDATITKITTDSLRKESPKIQTMFESLRAGYPDKDKDAFKEGSIYDRMDAIKTYYDKEYSDKKLEVNTNQFEINEIVSKQESYNKQSQFLQAEKTLLEKEALEIRETIENLKKPILPSEIITLSKTQLKKIITNAVLSNKNKKNLMNKVNANSKDVFNKNEIIELAKKGDDTFKKLLLAPFSASNKSNNEENGKKLESKEIKDMFNGAFDKMVELAELYGKEIDKSRTLSTDNRLVLYFDKDKKLNEIGKLLWDTVSPPEPSHKIILEKLNDYFIDDANLVFFNQIKEKYFNIQNKMDSHPFFEQYNLLHEDYISMIRRLLKKINKDMLIRDDTLTIDGLKKDLLAKKLDKLKKIKENIQKIEKRGKYTVVLFYTDILFQYFIYLLIIMDYLNYFYH